MEYDLKMTPEGDLVFGQQQTNEEGEFLYYMDTSGNGDVPFITTEPDGNTPICDLRPTYGDEARLQLLQTRVRTDQPDFRNYPQVGANLSDLIGLPNNQATAEQGAAMIKETLTYDGTFSPDELTVSAVPVARDTVLFDIKLARQNEHWRYAIVFSFDVGILNQYEMRQ